VRRELRAMFWHRFRLDWSYALGELLIVTVGVLIALAVNNWNSERLERAEERDVVARLISDIDGDLRRFEFQLGAIDKKEQSLQRLRAAFANSGPLDAAEFVADIIQGANFGGLTEYLRTQGRDLSNRLKEYQKTIA
jgi:hypothetical protein